MFNATPNTSEPASPALVRDFDSDDDDDDDDGDDDAVICYKAALTTTSMERVRFDMKKIGQIRYEKKDFEMSSAKGNLQGSNRTTRFVSPLKN